MENEHMVSVRRHARHWRTYLACGGLGLALALGGFVLGEQIKTSGGHYPGESTAQAPRPVTPTVNPFVYRYTCKRPRDSNEENLCIEKRAMKAGERQAEWAVLTFFLGLFGSVFIVGTLFYTRRAVVAAEQALTDLERPHAFVNIKLYLTLYDRTEERRASAYIEFSMANYGRFPAEIIECCVGVSQTAANKPIQGIIRDRFHRIIGPNETISNLRIDFPHDLNVRLSCDQDGEIIGASPYSKEDYDTFFRFDMTYKGLGNVKYTTMTHWRWDDSLGHWAHPKTKRT